MRKPKGPKLSLVFDEEKRKEYLTGFHKRKLERRKKGREAAEERLAEEIKAVKNKYREAARKRLADVNLPGFGSDPTLDVVRSREEHVVGDRTVVLEHIDVGNSHYFIGSKQSESMETQVAESAVQDISQDESEEVNSTETKDE